MSYEKVRSINFKEHTITSAVNNIRPLMYRTWEFIECSSDRDFIVSLLSDISDGLIRLNKKYHYLYDIIKKADIDDLIDIKWNRNTSEDDINKTEKLIEEKLYNAYINYTEKIMK